MSTLDPSLPEQYLAAALRRALEKHRSDRFQEIGNEYDQIELDTSPFRHLASDRFFTAFRFWDCWFDAATHAWAYYDGIAKDDWQRHAQSVIESLEKGTELTDPVLLKFIVHEPPRHSLIALARTIWSKVSNAWA
jgi:hypothetical protein